MENREGSKGRLVRRRRDFDLERCSLFGGKTGLAMAMIDGMFVSTWLLILLFKFLRPPPNASSLSPTHQAPVSEYSNPMALLNQQTVDYPSFKLVIVGDVRTGK
ncbi:hypothetical protein ACSBR1_014554 [Camellia fascicularis]